jgi:hypothetical protein
MRNKTPIFARAPEGGFSSRAGITSPPAELIARGPLMQLKGRMTITIDSKLEARIREKAEGLSGDAYVERLVTKHRTPGSDPRSALKPGKSSEPAEAGAHFTA